MPPSMNVTVLLFAQARERSGVSRVALEVESGSRVTDAIAALERTHPALVPLRPHLAFAVDGVLVRGDAALHPGAELAVLPPVSGG